jgi:hypothetical protein
MAVTRLASRALVKQRSRMLVQCERTSFDGLGRPTPLSVRALAFTSLRSHQPHGVQDDGDITADRQPLRPRHSDSRDQPLHLRDVNSSFVKQYPVLIATIDISRQRLPDCLWHHGDLLSRPWFPCEILEPISRTAYPPLWGHALSAATSCVRYTESCSFRQYPALGKSPFRQPSVKSLLRHVGLYVSVLNLTVMQREALRVVSECPVSAPLPIPSIRVFVWA